MDDGFILHEVIEMIRKICDKLEQLCDGDGIEEEKVEVINTLYLTIESSDYAGMSLTFHKKEA